MEKILLKVLKKITPTKKETETEKKIVQEIKTKLGKTKGKHSHLEWCGSSARGTHLCDDKDLDLFIMYEENVSEKELEEEGIKTAKKILGKNKWEKAYSQHPYIRGTINGFGVDIVPSYIVKKGNQKKSAVDRTPFHNKYLTKKLTKEQKKEVRILKQFLKGINAYGADLKNCSLPGYGVELLILKYGSFKNTLKKLSTMKHGHTIKFNNKKTTKFEEKYPLIIIDPIDEKRNVASALSEKQFSRIKHASQKFLKKPSINFFFPKKTKKLTPKKIREKLAKKELIIIKTLLPKKELEDIIWGQLRKQEKKLVKQLELNDFEVINKKIWGNKKQSYFIFELKQLILPKTKQIKGPLISDKENTKKFLEKKREIIGEPKIINERTIIQTKRKHTNAKKFLENKIKEEIKTRNKTIKEILKKAKILNTDEIINETKKEFGETLTRYLEKKEVYEQ